MDRTISILVCQDDPGALLAVRRLIDCQDRLRVVGWTNDADKAVEIAAQHKPDVAVFDLVVNGTDVTDWAAQVRAVSPQTALLIYCDQLDNDAVTRAFTAGVKGYCLRSTDAGHLTGGILSVLAGAGWLSPTVAGNVLKVLVDKPAAVADVAGDRFDFPCDSLSAQDRHLLGLIVAGCSHEEIARRLLLSPDAVRVQVQAVFDKMQVSNRTEATIKAVRFGIFAA